MDNAGIHEVEQYHQKITLIHKMTGVSALSGF
jgi:hypothetical protein